MTALQHIATEAAWTALQDARADVCAAAERHLESNTTESAAELRATLDVERRAHTSWRALAVRT